jgi:hypothetical protein
MGTYATNETPRKKTMFLDQIERLREIAAPTENVSRAGMAGAGTNSPGRMGRTMTGPAQASKQAYSLRYLIEKTEIFPPTL